jgi:hypothetical protein
MQRDTTSVSIPEISVIINGIKSILQNDYWTRIWIVQEVILSMDVRVYICEWEFRWPDFVRLCDMVVNSVQGNLALGFYSSGMILRLDQLRKDLFQFGFPDILRNFLDCQCLDVRDRVFGLMGLAKDVALEVDYNLSRFQLFEKLTRTYPVRFAKELAENLYIALHISDELHLATSAQLQQAIPIKIQGCGAIVRQNGRLLWNQRSRKILTSRSVLEDGDQLFSLSMIPVHDRRLIVLQDTPFPSTSTGIYFNIKAIVAVHSDDKPIARHLLDLDELS